MMSIVRRMIDASRDFELAGGTRSKFVVSPAGRDALRAWQEEFDAGFIFGNAKRIGAGDATKFMLGVPVEVDAEQTEEFIIR